MKNTIKKITAAISAAVMCALPMAESLTANAAQQYTTYRNTYFIKYENAKIKEAKMQYITLFVVGLPTPKPKAAAVLIT